MFNKIHKILILTLLMPLPAVAETYCRDVIAVGATYATGQTTFMGEADSSVGQMSVNVEITSTKPNADGSINATTSHTFSTRGLIFTTRDRARLVPLNDVGLYRLDTQATITEGDWLQRRVWGQLKLDGLIDLGARQPWARWLAEGVICAQ